MAFKIRRDFPLPFLFSSEQISLKSVANFLIIYFLQTNNIILHKLVSKYTIKSIVLSRNGYRRASKTWPDDQWIITKQHERSILPAIIR